MAVYGRRTGEEIRNKRNKGKKWKKIEERKKEKNNNRMAAMLGCEEAEAAAANNDGRQALDIFLFFKNKSRLPGT